VNVLSAIKVGGAVSALAWAVLGLIVACASLCAGSIMTSMLSPYSSYGGNTSSPLGGLLGAVIIYVLGFIGYGIGGAIAGAVYAFMYNLAAGVVGGLEIEVADLGPAVSSSPTSGSPAHY
jgi:hypothetical protein